MIPTKNPPCQTDHARITLDRSYRTRTHEPQMSKSLPQDEAALWRRMDSFLPDHIRARRIEAKSPPGVSDVYWTYNPRLLSATDCGWIELKSQVPDIRKEQRIWLRDMLRCGVPAHIVAEWKDRIFLIDPATIDLDLRIPYEQGLMSVPATANRTEWRLLWDKITQGGKG